MVQERYIVTVKHCLIGNDGLLNGASISDLGQVTLAAWRLHKCTC